MQPSLIGFTPLPWRDGLMVNCDEPVGHTTEAIA